MDSLVIRQVQDYLSSAEVLLVFSGAGMSADSGLPVYRGENGSWGRFEKEFGKNITELMTPAFIRQYPVEMWKRFSRGLAHLKQVQPHEGYGILMKWIQNFGLEYFAVTSNVDGLFIKAGFDQERVYEIHGASGYLQCTIPCRPLVWQEDYALYHEKEDLTYEDLPKCPHCRELVRPNVYIFKDRTFVPTRTSGQRECWEDFIKKHRHKKTLCLEIGAGPTIRTIRRLTEKVKTHPQTLALRINPHEYDIDPPHLFLATTALEALRLLDVAKS